MHILHREPTYYKSRAAYQSKSIQIKTPQLLSTEQSIYSTNTTTTVIMNSTSLLALFLLSIAHYSQLSRCETAASTLIDQSVKRAALLFRARERFSQVRANNTAWWDAALQDHSSYSHRELAFICTHIAYLDMVSTANTTGQLLPSGSPTEITFQQLKETSYRALCSIWVSHLSA